MSARLSLKCAVSRCLGHALERTEEVSCIRCGGTRWVLVRDGEPTPADYACQRCRAVLAGRKGVVDPGAHLSPTDAQRAAWASAAGRLQARYRPSEVRAATTLQTPSDAPSLAPDISGTSNTIIRRGRAFQPGRPRVPAIEQRQKARDRDRAYRARQRGEAA